MPGGETAYFVSLHRNKKGIVLDLKHPRGKETFLRMVERCDVVLENYRAGALARLGLDYETARQAQSRHHLLLRSRASARTGRTATAPRSI